MFWVAFGSHVNACSAAGMHAGFGNFGQFAQLFPKISPHQRSVVVCRSREQILKNEPQMAVKLQVVRILLV